MSRFVQKEDGSFAQAPERTDSDALFASLQSQFEVPLKTLEALRDRADKVRLKVAQVMGSEPSVSSLLAKIEVLRGTQREKEEEIKVSSHELALLEAKIEGLESAHEIFDQQPDATPAVRDLLNFLNSFRARQIAAFLQALEQLDQQKTVDDRQWEMFESKTHHDTDDLLELLSEDDEEEEDEEQSALEIRLLQNRTRHEQAMNSLSEAAAALLDVSQTEALQTLRNLEKMNTVDLESWVERHFREETVTDALGEGKAEVSKQMKAPIAAFGADRTEKAAKHMAAEDEMRSILSQINEQNGVLKKLQPHFGALIKIITDFIDHQSLLTGMAQKIEQASQAQFVLKVEDKVFEELKTSIETLRDKLFAEVKKQISRTRAKMSKIQEIYATDSSPLPMDEFEQAANELTELMEQEKALEIDGEQLTQDPHQAICDFLKIDDSGRYCLSNALEKLVEAFEIFQNNALGNVHGMPSEVQTIRESIGKLPRNWGLLVSGPKKAVFKKIQKWQSEHFSGTVAMTREEALSPEQIQELKTSLADLEQKGLIWVVSPLVKILAGDDLNKELRALTHGKPVTLTIKRIEEDQDRFTLKGQPLRLNDQPLHVGLAEKDEGPLTLLAEMMQSINAGAHEAMRWTVSLKAEA